MSKDMLGKIALVAVAGLIKDMFDKLNGPNGQEWLKGLKKFLRGELVWVEDSKTRPNLPVWSTFELDGIKYELVAPSVRELGFSKLNHKVPMKEIIARAIFLGLGFCPEGTSEVIWKNGGTQGHCLIIEGWGKCSEHVETALHPSRPAQDGSYEPFDGSPEERFGHDWRFGFARRVT